MVLYQIIFMEDNRSIIGALKECLVISDNFVSLRNEGDSEAKSKPKLTFFTPCEITQGKQGLKCAGTRRYCVLALLRKA